MVDVYLASPGFSDIERSTLRKYETALESCGYQVFSPFRDQPKSIDFKSSAGRKQIFDSNADAIIDCKWMVANLDFTTINGKYPIAIPDTGVIFEIGLAHGLRQSRSALYGPERAYPYIIGVTTDTAWGINVMLEFGVDGYISGYERFETALLTHKNLDIFLGKIDHPQSKDYIIY